MLEVYSSAQFIENKSLNPKLGFGLFELFNVGLIKFVSRNRCLVRMQRTCCSTLCGTGGRDTLPTDMFKMVDVQKRAGDVGIEQQYKDAFTIISYPI